jgi:hypothetical protein
MTCSARGAAEGGASQRYCHVPACLPLCLPLCCPATPPDLLTACMLACQPVSHERATGSHHGQHFSPRGPHKNRTRIRR